MPPGGVRIEVSADDYADKEVETFVTAKTPPLRNRAIQGSGSIAGYLAGIDGLTPVPGQVSLGNLDEDVGSHGADRQRPANFRSCNSAPGRYQLSGQGDGLNGQQRDRVGLTMSGSKALCWP